LLLAQKRIVLEDGCIGSPRAEECRTVYNGAMVHGVHSAVQVYTTLALELLAQRAVSSSEV
jgi:hypothetical protein